MTLGGALQATVAIKAIDAAVDEAADVPWNCVDPDELADAVARMETVASKMACLRARVLAETEQSPVAARHSFRTTDQYVAARTGGDPAEIRAELRIGRWLRLFPLFADAYASGRLSRGHVEWMRRGHVQRIHHSLIDAQQNLIEAAGRLDWVDWLQVWGYFLIAADPDGQLPKNQINKRRCTIRKRPDGTVSGTFHLDRFRPRPQDRHRPRNPTTPRRRRPSRHQPIRHRTHRRRPHTGRHARRRPTLRRPTHTTHPHHPRQATRRRHGQSRHPHRRRRHRPPIRPQRHQPLVRTSRRHTTTPPPRHVSAGCRRIHPTRLRPRQRHARPRRLNPLLPQRHAPEFDPASPVERIGASGNPQLGRGAAATDPSPRKRAGTKHGPTATHNAQTLCQPDNRHKRDR